jgi:hypothetical protein
VLAAGGDLVDSFSYWTFCDVFEEAGIPTTLLHGGSASHPPADEEADTTSTRSWPGWATSARPGRGPPGHPGQRCWRGERCWPGRRSTSTGAAPPDRPSCPCPCRCRAPGAPGRSSSFRSSVSDRGRQRHPGLGRSCGRRPRRGRPSWTRCGRAAEPARSHRSLPGRPPAGSGSTWFTGPARGHPGRAGRPWWTRPRRGGMRAACWRGDEMTDTTRHHEPGAARFGTRPAVEAGRAGSYTLAGRRALPADRRWRRGWRHWPSLGRPAPGTTCRCWAAGADPGRPGGGPSSARLCSRQHRGGARPGTTCTRPPSSGAGYRLNALGGLPDLACRGWRTVQNRDQRSNLAQPGTAGGVAGWWRGLAGSPSRPAWTVGGWPWPW